MSSPETWGAAKTAEETYGRPGEPRFGDEFVLRFDSVAAAHRAVADAWRLYHDCPTPRTVEADPWDLPMSGVRWHLSEYFAGERVGHATHSLLVARRQNVVVVIEVTMTDDRFPIVLGVAMARATGDMKRERVILSAIGGSGGWVR